MERVPINSCSFQELAKVPGVGFETAGQILELRHSHGGVTPDMLGSLSLQCAGQLAEVFDFGPNGSLLLRPHPSPGNVKQTSPQDPERRGSTPFSSTPMTGYGNRPSADAGSQLDFEEHAYDAYSPPPTGSARVTPARHTSMEQSGRLPQYYPSDTSHRGDGEYLGRYGEKEETLHRSQARLHSRSRTGTNYNRLDELQHGPHIQSVPKNISFSGRENWPAFYSKFRAFASECKWSGRQCRDQMCWCLEGKASEYFTLMTDRYPNAEYYDLINKMERRFGYEELPEAFQLEFNYARQGSGESVLDWADRVTHLATQSFPDLPEIHLQKQIVLKFCQGCTDRDAGLQALNMRPQTLDIAVDRVKWHQHTQRAIFGRSCKDVRHARVVCEDYPTDVAPQVSKVGSRTHSIRHTETSPIPSDCERRMTGLEGKLDTLTVAVSQLASMQKLTNQRRSNSAPTGFWNRTRSQSPDPQKSACYGCGGLGHYKRDCPERTSEMKVSFVGGYTEDFSGETASNCSGSVEEKASPRPVQQ